MALVAAGPCEHGVADRICMLCNPGSGFEWAPREYAERAIIVWRFEDAPKELRQLSEHGGDEDWVALIPDAMEDDPVAWAEDGTHFGPCEVTEHKIEGYTVRMGAHL